MTDINQTMARAALMEMKTIQDFMTERLLNHAQIITRLDLEKTDLSKRLEAAVVKDEPSA